MDVVQRGASKNVLDLVHRACVVLKNVLLGQICGGHLNLGYHDKPEQEEVFHEKLLSQPTRTREDLGGWTPIIHGVQAQKESVLKTKDLRKLVGWYLKSKFLPGVTAN